MFKIKVRNDPKFYIKLKKAISGWVFKQEKTNFSIKGYIGNEDKYAKDLPQYARELPLLAKVVCGRYVYVKSLMRALPNKVNVVSDKLSAKVIAFIRGDTYLSVTSFCRACIGCKMTSDVLKYSINTDDVSAKIAYKAYLDGVDFTVVNGCKERFGIIAKGSTKLNVRTSSCMGWTKAKARGGSRHGLKSIASGELHRLLYAKDNPVYAKDNPIYAKDSCYVVV